MPAVIGKPARRIVIVERPEAPQTVLRIGHVGVARSSPDYVALDVMNTAFGGLFSSRINLNLAGNSMDTPMELRPLLFSDAGPGRF